MADTVTLSIVLSITIWILGVVLTLLILWLIIRGAVLSALRQYRREASTDGLE